MTTTLTLNDCTKAFAEPGQSNMIDLIHPITGRSFICNETLEQVRERYPLAEIVDVSEWHKQKGALQDSVITWDEITQAQYDEWMNCLPPIAWSANGFMVGEPSDHHAVIGLPRYQGCIARYGKYFASSRPMTVKEFKSL